MVDIKRVQNRLLEMAKEIVKVFDKHNIQYMIAYGTLLGAVRNEGFIPWDDDFDIFLFEDENNNYEETIKLLQEELPKDMFVEYFNTEPKYFHAWAHIKDLGSEVQCEEYPQDGAYAHHGISIDLYRTKKMKEKDLKDYMEKENRKYLDRRKKYNLITEEEYHRKLETDAIISDSSYNKYGEEWVYETFADLVYMKINEIFPLKKYKFEDIYLLGPNNADGLLTRSYGNYMQLPPANKQKSHYSSVVFLEK